jgi:NTE family protein
VADVTAAAGRVTWVDGGMLDNFPVDVFDRTDGAASRWPTIGIKLSARQTSISGGHGTDNVAAEAIACLETVLDNAGRYYISRTRRPARSSSTNAGIKATDFNLTPDQRQKLYENGQQAAQRWWRNRRTEGVTARQRCVAASWRSR